MSLEDLITILDYEVVHTGLPNDTYPALRQLVYTGFTRGYNFYLQNVRMVYAPFRPFGTINGIHVKHPNRQIGKVKNYGKSGKISVEETKVLEHRLVNSNIPTSYLAAARQLMVNSFMHGADFSKQHHQPQHGYRQNDGLPVTYLEKSHNVDELVNALKQFALK